MSKMAARRGKLIHSFMWVWGTVCLLGVAGCTTTQKVDQGVKDSAEKVDRLFPSSSEGQATVLTGALVRSNTPYFGRSVASSDTGDALPPEYEKRFKLGLSGSLSEIVAKLNGAFPHLHFIDAQDEFIGGGVSPSATRDSTALSRPAKELVDAVNGDQGTGTSGAGGVSGSGRRALSMDINHDGSLSDLIAEIKATFRLQALFDRSSMTVTFSRNQARVFRIRSLAIETSMETDFKSNGTKSGDEGAQATQVTSIKSKSEIWEAIRRNCEVYVAPFGGKVVVEPSIGTVLVVAPKPAMDRVAAFLADENDRLGRTVLVDVNILSVQSTGEEDAGLLANLNFSGTDSTAISTVGNSGLTSSSLGTATFQVVSPLVKKSTAWGALSGSSLVIQALRQQVNAKLEYSYVYTVGNEQAQPIQVTTRDDYLQSVQANPVGTVAGSGTTASQLVPGTTTSGYQGFIQPRIEDDGTIRLYLQLSQKDPATFTSQSSGGESIQLAHQPQVILTQYLPLQSGETMIASGFDQNQQTSSRTVTVGEGTSATLSRRRFIMVITVSELDNKRQGAVARGPGAIQAGGR